MRHTIAYRYNHDSAFEIPVMTGCGRPGGEAQATEAAKSPDFIYVVFMSHFQHVVLITVGLLTAVV